MAAKEGKLRKLKSVLKKWHSFSNKESNRNSDDGESEEAAAAVVYVGKTRRRYLIKSAVAEHPVFQELVERSSSSGDGEDYSIIELDCEVVLFEHLLWMLQNADSSLDLDLLHFYAR